MTRTELERLIIGKRISEIRWADVDDFGHTVSPVDTAFCGLNFDDGTFISVEGSGQIDVASVWLIADRKANY